MTVGINGLLTIGNHALQANQTAINVTANNVANVNTLGYNRQNVRFEAFTPVNASVGQIGMGAYAAEVTRTFDRFLENSYLEQFSASSQWNEQAAVMGSVENLFNEANTPGVHNQVSEFFKSWGDLSTNPSSLPTRQALLTQSQNMGVLIRDTMNSLDNMSKEMDDFIKMNVNQVNEIVTQIADINGEIVKTHNPPHNNANSLLDQRDQLVRSLSQIVDIVVRDNGPNDFNVYLKEGMPLVEGDSQYELTLNGSFYENDTKNFTGNVNVEGQDSSEYTLEFVSEDEFRVSLDGGKTWLSDEKGQTHFKAPPVGEKITIKDISISFDGGGYVEGQNVKFDEGDKIYIVPKDTIFWSKPTRDPIDVSKIIESESLGGQLGAYLNVRDKHIGDYKDKLNAFAETLIWETNRIHSQGSGLEAISHMIGTTQVQDLNLALGSKYQSMPYADRLEPGNITIHFYDDVTGESTISGPLNFNPNGDPLENFDPEIHSLHDVQDAINRSYVDPKTGFPLITATIEGGALQLTAAKGSSFKMGTDTTGLLTALGVNTFFEGSSAYDIDINQNLINNPNLINAHSVDGDAEGNSGDSLIATRIAKLATASVNFSTTSESSSESLLSYYSGIVGSVGADTRNANFNAKYYGTLASELNSQVLSKTGVNLDDEMMQLIRFQHSYTAAAKLITTADQMLETILGLKQ